MKTTIELPDDLMQRIKLRAVHEHKKLKQSIAELLERGLVGSDSASAGMKRPKALRLRGRVIPTDRQIRSAIARGRD